MRRLLGLLAFFYVCLHFSVWIGLDHFFDWRRMWEDVLKRPFITVGVLALVLLIPLAVTSTTGMYQAAGRGELASPAQARLCDRRAWGCSTSCGSPSAGARPSTTTRSRSLCCSGCGCGTGYGNARSPPGVKHGTLSPGGGEGRVRGIRATFLACSRDWCPRRDPSRVQHFFDLGQLFLDQPLDAGLERHVRRAAALASAAHLEIHLVLLDVDELDEAAVTGHRWIDGRVDQLLHLGHQIFAHRPTS